MIATQPASQSIQPGFIPPQPAATAPAEPVAPPVQPVPAQVPAPEPATSPFEPQAELVKLRQKVESYRNSLQQWTQAESDWNSQRRLFELILENVADLIVLTSTDGNRLWNNSTYSRVMGFKSNELVGTYVLTEVHPEDQARATAALTETVRQGASRKLDYRVQQKGGTWVVLETSILPIVNPDGKVESVLLVSKDVTEAKRLADELAMATAEVTVTNIFEAMANDFDQILTNVLGNLTIAKNLNGPHNAVSIRLNEIDRSLQRARELLEQMFSATNKGTAKVRIALGNALEETVASVLRGTMIRAEYLFPRNLPELELDPESLSHAIRNIVTNSVQAMDKGVIRFTAESISRDQMANRPELPLRPNDYLRVTIQDQGHGIAEKALPRVFEPYFTTRQGSQGLGLTRALAIIQRMGGTILMDSTPGVGTTTSIYLPIAKEETEDASTAPEAAVPLPGQAGTAPTRTATVSLPKIAKKKRILLMDDEQMILDIVSRMLGHLGYDVSTCTDGSQAIAAFTKAKSQGESFDVVMMDLVIPSGVGGEDAVKTIKKIDPSARVVASSGHLDHPVMLDHSKFGFTAVLEKPYKLEKLQQVIEAVISAQA